MLITNEKVKRKKEKSFSKFVLSFVIYISIVGGIVFGVPRFLVWWLQTPYPMAAITSGSMWPALREGSLVFVQGVARDDIQVDDIVVYQNEGGRGFTIHRVVRMDHDKIVTKGDANFAEDKPVAYERIVGRALTWFGRPVGIPFLGSITVLANNLQKEKEIKIK